MKPPFERSTLSQYPRVSVLMPTYRQAAFLARALESLRAQTFQAWELVVIDDSSPDDTADIMRGFLDDERIHYRRLRRNVGIGMALNAALALARGQYIAYLPSDDLYYPDHLQRLVDLLESRPDVYLAYGGVRWGYDRYMATLQGDTVVGREADALANPPPVSKTVPLNSGNLWALVQVMHRRDFEDRVRWTPRRDQVSDRLEVDYWRSLARHGVRFAYAGAITAEWVDHPMQHHKLVASRNGGLARYRQYYGIGRDEPLNWQPSLGPRVDERERYGRYRVSRKLPSPGGLRILLVGELGFNPERIMALEEHGHKLYGLWHPEPENWDTTGPLSFGNVNDVPFDGRWKERARALRPDVIYALLNWQAVPFIHEVFSARLGVPFVFHFKEGPFICQEKGTWPLLMRLLTESDGQIFINDESLEWFQLATHHALDPERTLVLDGDLPKLDLFTDEWTPKRSAEDGQIHTVCAGRIIGIEQFSLLADQGIHFHFYGDHFHQMSPNFVRDGLATGHLHLHNSIGPQDWVRELSQYDAAWFHIYDSHNAGDLRRANWDDLNLPARLGTYAAAGLPWIMKDSAAARTGLKSLALKHDVGVLYRDYEHLGALLRDRERVARMTANMRAARSGFAFDTHVERLIQFFQAAISRHSTRRGFYANR